MSQFEDELTGHIGRTLSAYEPPYDPADWAAMKRKLQSKKRGLIIWWQPAKAAAVLVPLFVVGYLLLTRSDQRPKEAGHSPFTSINPSEASEEPLPNPTRLSPTALAATEPHPDPQALAKKRTNHRKPTAANRLVPTSGQSTPESHQDESEASLGTVPSALFTQEPHRLDSLLAFEESTIGEDQRAQEERTEQTEHNATQAGPARYQEPWWLTEQE
ncbi:MAG: hypothetical protein HC842_01695, partial [Cytophagales bacterium]|nr:hypothetical protein [Cytophagales bacterium]